MVLSNFLPKRVFKTGGSFNIGGSSNPGGGLATNAEFRRGHWNVLNSVPKVCYSGKSKLIDRTNACDWEN